MCTFMFPGAAYVTKVIQSDLNEDEPTLVIYGPKGGCSSCVLMVLPAPPATYRHDVTTPGN
jgi:hypothetical protein